MLSLAAMDFTLHEGFSGAFLKEMFSCCLKWRVLVF